MFNHRNIYLIGPMAAGKTSIGKELANISGLSFYDSDHEIERNSGKSIASIFYHEQEDGFRCRETLILENLAQQQDIVLATGGGCVTIKKNREILRNNSLIIYLQVTLETQLLRISQQLNKRPLIVGRDHSEKLKILNLQREPWYLELAALCYHTEGFPSPKDVAQQIHDDLGSAQLTCRFE